MNSIVQPFFRELRKANRIVVAGAGGGFDVFSGLPLYFNLRAAGKEVFLANLSFSTLTPESGRHLTSNLIEVTADSDGSLYYFPEKYLAEWFRNQGRDVPIYAIPRTGPKYVAEAWRALVDELRPDTIILVDGGTDSLMRGDEIGLGTPVEDMSSIAAVQAINSTTVPRKLLACLGFGVDSYHGVSQGLVLEAIAELIREGGYLGTFSLTADMPEVQKFVEATEYVMAKTPGRESIVCSSILSALEGKFGDHHRNQRTFGDRLFINPLMSLYFCFGLEAVAKRCLYLDRIGQIESFSNAEAAIRGFHAEIKSSHRPWLDLPM